MSPIRPLGTPTTTVTVTAGLTSTTTTATTTATSYNTWSSYDSQWRCVDRKIVKNTGKQPMKVKIRIQEGLGTKIKSRANPGLLTAIGRQGRPRPTYRAAPKTTTVTVPPGVTQQIACYQRVKVKKLTIGTTTTTTTVRTTTPRAAVTAIRNFARRMRGLPPAPAPTPVTTVAPPVSRTQSQETEEWQARAEIQTHTVRANDTPPATEKPK